LIIRIEGIITVGDPNEGKCLKCLSNMDCD